MQWTPLQVGAFIRSISPAFGPYAAALEAEGVTGEMLVTDIDEAWILENVKSVLHRKTLTRELTRLKTPGTKFAHSELLS